MSALTGGRLLARNTLFNLAGQAAPMLLAFFAIPLLIQGMGTARFGVLTLAWMVIGYLSIADLGVGRALTQILAEKLGAEQKREIPALIWTALLLMLVLGIAGAGLLGLLTPALVRRVLNVPGALQREALDSFYLLALSLPFVVSTAALRGILEAQQRFGLVNAVRVPMGIFTFLGPLLVLPFSSSLVPVVAVLVAGRVVAWLIHLGLCLRVVPALRDGIAVERSLVRPLLRFGSWMTVSNVVSPLMVSLDRFLIGALLSVSAVAFYVTPYEMVTKLSLVSGALTTVLFPAFAMTFAQDRARMALLLERGLKAVFLVLFPVMLVLVTLAHEALSLWVGAEFARKGTHVLQWLAAGVFVNSIANLPFNAVQGAGRADLTAKLHLLELPLYLAAAWWLIQAYGIEGAAIAWVARVVMDAAVLLGMTERILPVSAPAIHRTRWALAAALLTLGAVAVFPASLATKGVFLLLVLLAFVLLTWFVVLDEAERALVQGRLDFGRGNAA